MQKVKIYCLIDPRTDKPFYVGSTKMKLNHRLNMHCASLWYYPGKKVVAKRHAFITKMKKAGFRPIIKLLREVDFNKVDWNERYFYNKYLKSGFKLLQSCQFEYQKNKQKHFANAR